MFGIFMLLYYNRVMSSFVWLAPNERVWSVRSRQTKSLPSHRQQILSAPMHSIIPQKNVIIGFNNEKTAEFYISDMLPLCHAIKSDWDLLDTSLEDLEYVASLMHMPLVVICNSYCPYPPISDDANGKDIITHDMYLARNDERFSFKRCYMRRA
jgi:hypothetical protein